MQDLYTTASVMGIEYAQGPSGAQAPPPWLWGGGGGKGAFPCEMPRFEFFSFHQSALQVCFCVCSHLRESTVVCRCNLALGNSFLHCVHSSLLYFPFFSRFTDQTKLSPLCVWEGGGCMRVCACVKEGEKGSFLCANQTSTSFLATALKVSCWLCLSPCLLKT